MEKKQHIQLAIVAVLAMLIPGCGKDSTEATEDFSKITNVEIYTVSATYFEDYITLPVVVRPYREVNLGLTTGGKVTKIHVDKGDKVTEGMILLETDDVLLKSSYEQAKANFEFQKKEFARSKKLFEDGSITEAAYDGAELQLEIATSSYQIAKKSYEDATLKAPFPGVITAKNIEVGDILGSGMPAFRIIDVSKVKVQAGIPEKYIASFATGSTVGITFDSIPERTFEGKLNYIAPEASTSVRTFLAEIIIDNSDGCIMAGILGNAHILKKLYENVTVVPVNSVINSQNGNVIYVACKDNTAERRDIELGDGRNDLMVLVTKGIGSGDRVIVKGQHNLVDGERINITGTYAADSAEGSEQ